MNYVSNLICYCCKRKPNLRGTGSEKIKNYTYQDIQESIDNVLSLQEYSTDYNNKVKNSDSKVLDDYGVNLLIEEKTDDDILIPEKFIRNDELGKITFSINGIMKFIKEYLDLKEEFFKPLYNKNNLVLHYTKGSILSNEFLLGKLAMTISKSTFVKPVDVNLLTKFLYDPDFRTKFDTSIKEYKIYEKGDKYFIYKLWLNSPLFLISERDFIDKRIEFTREGIYYTFASSINNYEEEIEGVVRCINYLNILTISEDNENFYFNSFTQMDAKVKFVIFS